MKKLYFKEDLYYDSVHGWLRVEGNIATQGLTDFGQAVAQEIAFVEVPRTGRVVEQGKQFMSLESGKWVGRIPAMVSGTIVAVNDTLEWEPEKVNQFPYDDGWLVRIEFSDPAELENLMRYGSPEWEAFIAKQTEKYEDIL